MIVNGAMVIVVRYTLNNASHCKANYVKLFEARPVAFKWAFDWYTNVNDLERP